MTKNVKILIGIGVIVLGVVIVVLMRGGLSTPVTPPKVYTVGVMHYIKSIEKVDQGFYKGMENLGYSEGKNVHYIITPFASDAEMESIAQGLIAQKVDLIVAITNVAATGAKKATEKAGRTDIPIVFSHANVPDATGLIKSFKSSGNNLTGIAVNLPEVTEKRIQFLREIKPSIKRIGILDSVQKDSALIAALPQIQKAAQKFGIELVTYTAQHIGEEGTKDVIAIANGIKPGEIDAFFYMPGPASFPPPNVAAIVGMTKRLKIPAAFVLESQTEQGGLFTYADDLLAMGEQTAIFVDKVFKGQQPSDIPVEFPKKERLVINNNTAKESGLTMPQSMLSIADKVIQ